MPPVPANLVSLQAQSVLNIGRQRNFITGIQGVAAGGQASINMACDRRYHRLLFQVTAVNFTGGLGLTATKVTSTAGAALQVDVTVAANHTVATIVPTSGHAGTGWVTGDTMTFTDATGTGFLGTVTASSGAVTAIAITVNGTPSAIDASVALGTVKLTVNGVNVADLTAGQEIIRALFYGQTVTRGQFPIFFTEPWRNFTRFPENTAWDMAGQSAFQIQIQFNSNLVSPGLTGDMEFDYIRNTTKGGIVATFYQQLISQGQAPAPILAPISRHAFTFQLNAGLNLIGQGQIPFNYPIVSLLMIGSVPGNITQLEIDQDQSKVEEGYIITQNNGGQLGQTTEMLLEYGYVPSVVDAAYVATMNKRIDTALKCRSNLQLKIYSAVAQSLTILQEKLPGSYSS